MKSTIFRPAPLFQRAQAGHFQALAAWQPIDKPLHSTKLCTNETDNQHTTHRRPAVPLNRVINNPDHVVEDMLAGWLLAHADTVAATDNPRVLRRRAAPQAGKVGVVTGGGSGPEPAFLGYLGGGLLDAVAICELFSFRPPPPPPPAWPLPARRPAAPAWPACTAITPATT